MRMRILKFDEAMKEGEYRTNVVHIQFREK